MKLVNPNLGPDPVRALADGAERGRPLSRYEIHNIYREMVRWELSNGRLSAWRRRRLVQYAAGLGLRAVEAGELIQEVVRSEGRSDFRDDDAPAAPPPRAAVARGWPVWAKLALTLVAVVVVEVALTMLFV